MWKENYQSTDNTKYRNGKERENSYRKLKRSLKERHTQTHRNLFETLDDHRCNPPGATFQNSIMMPSLSCVHIHLLSSNWERHLWSSKYFNILCYRYFWYFPFNVVYVYKMVTINTLTNDHRQWIWSYSLRLGFLTYSIESNFGSISAKFSMSTRDWYLTRIRKNWIAVDL